MEHLFVVRMVHKGTGCRHTFIVDTKDEEYAVATVKSFCERNKYDIEEFFFEVDSLANMQSEPGLCWIL